MSTLPIIFAEGFFVRIDGDGEPVPIAPHVHKKISKITDDDV